MIRFAPLVILAVLLGLFMLGIGRDAQTPELAMANRPVPATSIDGISADDFKNGTVLVNFFASWCVTCVAEQKVFADIGAKNPDLKIIGIAYKDDPVKTALWLKRHGNPFDTIGHDPKGVAGLEWGVTGVPETYIIKDGIVRGRAIGALPPHTATALLAKATP